MVAMVIHGRTGGRYLFNKFGLLDAISSYGLQLRCFLVRWILMDKEYYFILLDLHHGLIEKQHLPNNPYGLHRMVVTPPGRVQMSSFPRDLFICPPTPKHMHAKDKETEKS